MLKTDFTKGASEIDLPKIIEIEPTHTCNSRCIMCHTRYEELTHTMISPDIVDQLCNLKDCWVMVGSMYEPLAHPKIGEILQGFSRLGMKIDLTTNGTLMDDKKAALLSNCNIKNLTFSFDGIEEKTYESIRVGARYKSTIKRIKHCIELFRSKDTFINVNFTVMRRNYREIPSAVDFWEEVGIDHIGFIAMVKRNDRGVFESESPQLILDSVKEKLWEAAEKIISGNYRITISSSYFQELSSLKVKYPQNFIDSVVVSNNQQRRTPYDPRGDFQIGDYPGMHVACRSPFVFARIAYDSNVFLCHNIKIGNLKNSDFKSIWFGTKANRIREKVLKDAKLCESCDYFRFCLRGGNVDYEKKDNFSSSQILGRSPNNIGVYGGYNIITWMREYYAVPIEIVDRAVTSDFFLDDLNQEDEILRGRSRREIEAKIESRMLETVTFYKSGFKLLKNPICFSRFLAILIEGYISSNISIKDYFIKISKCEDNLLTIVPGSFKTIVKRFFDILRKFRLSTLLYWRSH